MFGLFSHSSIVFLGVGVQKSCFQKLSGCLKRGFEKKMAILLCLWRKTSTKEEHQKKEKLQNIPRKIVFFGWVGKSGFCQIWHVWEYWKTLFVFGRGKVHFFIVICFGKIMLFCFFENPREHYKNRSSAGIG